MSNYTLFPYRISHPDQANLASRNAARASRQMSKKSRILDRQKEDAVPRFRTNEIRLGPMLGRGGFNSVCEILKFEIEENDDCLDSLREEGLVATGDVLCKSCQEREKKCEESEDEGEDKVEVCECEKDLIEDAKRSTREMARQFLRRHCRRSEEDVRQENNDVNDGVIIVGGMEGAIQEESNEQNINDEPVERKNNRIGDARYAIKFLRTDIMSNPDRFTVGASDLATEARFLASLEHPNIIKLRGITEGGVAGFTSGLEGGYFLILDRLYETLERRMEMWGEELRKLQGEEEEEAAGGGSDRMKKVVRSGKKAVKKKVVLKSRIKTNNNTTPQKSPKRAAKTQQIQTPSPPSTPSPPTPILKKIYHTLFPTNGKRRLLRRKRAIFDSTRLLVAFDIAGALKYLHSHDIIYRDLKPDNIGFDVRGDVKLFDFGLAKELNFDRKGVKRRSSTIVTSSNVDHNEDNDKLLDLSGNCGTLRYMAPEVSQSKPYNLSADVYSYSLVLHEIWSLKQPFADIVDKSEHSKRVVDDNERPDVDPSWSTELCHIMEKGWSNDLEERPNMEFVYGVLRKEIMCLRGDGDESGLDHERRRSTHVFDGPARMFRGIFNKDWEDDDIREFDDACSCSSAGTGINGPS